jgi:phosphatidate cytidylyltransferase
MSAAAVTGVVLLLAVIIVFRLGTVLAAIASTAVVFLAAAEAYAGFRRAGYQPATLLGLLASVSLMVATYNKGQAALPLIVVLLVVFTLLWYMGGVQPGADPVLGTGSTLLVFCWVGVLGSFAGLLLNPNLFPNRHGLAFLIGAIVTSVACDVGALAVGNRFGHHPLARSVSPNKTWEGAVGGAVASVLAAIIVVHFIHPWTLSKAVALGFVVAVVSPIGDLCESMIKRHLGVKDMGRLLPGHGGVLDRIDGLLFVLPATYYLVKAVHLG